MDNKGKNGLPTSWICTCISSGEVFEVFTRKDLEKIEATGLFTVEEAGDYLGRINEEIKANG